MAGPTISARLPPSAAKLFFLADEDGSISREFGAADMPRTVVLDPMLRSIADIAWDNPQRHSETVGNALRSPPPVDESTGVPMFAPALIVPRVFSFELCDFLMQFYEQQGGTDSGFQFDISGKTTTISDWRLKRRSDVPRTGARPDRAPAVAADRAEFPVQGDADGSLHRRLLRRRGRRPFPSPSRQRQRRRATSALCRVDQPQQQFRGLRPLVSGIRPQDLPAAGRRRAGVLMRRAAHQVTPVTEGRRYAFLAFLYGEEDAKKREANNSRLHAGEQQYTGGRDRCFPRSRA